MRAYVVVAAIACCLVLNASAFVPRQRRDVSELAATNNDAVEQPAYEYLPPEPKLAPALEPEVQEIETTTAAAAPTTTLAPEPSVRVGENGYEYRTVRRLKYRTRRLRDVSHLSTHYLPPATPQRDYLPPVAAAQEAAPAPAPVDDTEEVVAAAPAPKVANDYLPPVQETPVVTEPVDIETEAPAAALPEEVPADRIAEEEEEVEQPQDTAVLAEDGYHYKQPEQPFELKQAPAPAAPTPAAPAVTAAPVAPEYLPPLTDDTVAVEGPEESAVLAADGYHYRAIRRLRF